MTDQTAFEAAIGQAVETSHDPAGPRLVFADWLDEQNTPEDSLMARYQRWAASHGKRPARVLRYGRSLRVPGPDGSLSLIPRVLPFPFSDDPWYWERNGGEAHGVYAKLFGFLTGGGPLGTDYRLYTSAAEAESDLRVAFCILYCGDAFAPTRRTGVA